MIKRFQEFGLHGCTIGITIPFARLSGGKAPTDPDFVNELSGLREYEQKRTTQLESLPWKNKPVPTRYAIVSDLGRYGEGIYYGARRTSLFDFASKQTIQ